MAVATLNSAMKAPPGVPQCDPFHPPKIPAVADCSGFVGDLFCKTEATFILGGKPTCENY